MCAKNFYEFAWDIPWLPRCSDILSDSSTFVLYDFIRVSNSTNPPDYGSERRNLPINACYTQEMEQKCTVEASAILLGVVIACIVSKTLCMLWILWQLRETPLVVLGDAIASFMTELDKNTKNACLGPLPTFRNGKPWQATRKWSSKAERWSSNVSRAQWATCILMYALRELESWDKLTLKAGASSLLW